MKLEEKWHLHIQVQAIQLKLNKKLSKINKGRKFSIETRQNMSKNHANVSCKNNPCYGKICVTNGKINKYIDPEELNNYILQGYTKGLTRK